MYEVEAPQSQGRPPTVRVEQDDIVTHWQNVDPLHSVRYLIGALWYWRYLIVVIGLLAIAASIFVALRLPEQFQSYAQLAVLPENGDPLREEVGFEHRFDDPVSIESELRILQTREIFEEVAKRLNLIENQHFNTAPSQVSRFAQVAAEALGEEQLPTEATPADDDRAHDEIVDNLYQSVSPVQMGQSRVIEIGVTSPDRNLSADIANTMMDVHIERQVERRRNELEQTVETLSKRRDELENKVRQLQTDRNDLLREQARFHVGDSRALEEVLQSLEADVVDATVEAKTAQAKNNAVQAAMASGTWPSSLAPSPLIEELSTDLAQRSSEFSELTDRLGSGHPRYQAALAAVNETRAALADAKRSVALGIETELQVAQARLASVTQARAEIRNRLQSITDNDVDVSAIEMELEDAVAILQTVSQRLDLFEERAAALRPTVEIVGRANPALDASGPSKRLVVIAGTFLGGILAVIAALTLDWLTRLVRRRDHVLDAAHAPSLLVPSARSPGRSWIAPSKKKDIAFKRALRAYSLSTVLPQLSQRVGQGERIVVTSPSRAEGKSTVALSLARSLAEDGKKVLLILSDRPDFGFESTVRKKQAASMSQSNALSVVEHDHHEETPLVIQGEAEASHPQTITRDELGLVDIWSATPDNLASITNRTPRWDLLVNQAAQAYDVVVVDAPGLLVHADAGTLLGLADRCLLVVRRDATRKDELRSAYYALMSFPIQHVEVVGNEFA